MPHTRRGFAGAGKRGSAGLLLSMAFMLACIGSVRAANGARDSSQEASRATRLDEITVPGELNSLSAIKQALRESEKRFNARYNELNKDDDYDVVCSDDIPTDSHIPRWGCQASIVAKITEQQAKDFIRNPGTGPAFPITAPDIVRRQAMFEVEERTRALVGSDPELQRELLEHAQLERILNKAIKKKSRWHLFGRD